MDAPARGTSGTAIVAVSVGLVLAYAGLKGKSVGDAVRNALTGRNPADSPQLFAVTAPPTTPDAAVTAVTGDVATPGLLARTGGNRATIVNAAHSQLGKPYVWATPVSFSNPNPNSFDCSGLTGWCYQKIGVALAHYTGTQYTQLQHVPFAAAQPGDLVFYKNLVEIYHVAIYIGNGQIIEAPETGIPVRIRAVHAGDSDLMSTVGVVPNGN